MAASSAFKSSSTSNLTLSGNLEVIKRSMFSNLGAITISAAPDEISLITELSSFLTSAVSIVTSRVAALSIISSSVVISLSFLLSVVATPILISLSFTRVSMSFSANLVSAETWTVTLLLEAFIIESIVFLNALSSTSTDSTNFSESLLSLVIISLSLRATSICCLDFLVAVSRYFMLLVDPPDFKSLGKSSSALLTARNSESVLTKTLSVCLEGSLLIILVFFAADKVTKPFSTDLDMAEANAYVSIPLAAEERCFVVSSFTAFFI